MTDLLPSELSVSKSVLKELTQCKLELETQNEELRCIQLELEKSRNRYFELYDLAPIGYCTLNKHAQIIDINKAGLVILGSEKYQLINQTMLSFIAPKSRDIFAQHLQKTLASHKTEHCEIQIIRADQSVLHIQLVSLISPQQPEHIEAIKVTLIDVTVRHHAQKQLHQQQEQMNHMNRLVTMGEMASTLAHELNQPLAAIMHYLGGCLERLKHIDIPQDVRQAIERVLHSAEHAGGIIHRVRNYCKKGHLEKKPCDLHQLIQSVIDCQQYELQAQQIDLQLNLSSDTLQVPVDSLQIEQVFIIVLTNAIEALKTCNKKSRQLRIQTQIEPPWFLVTFTDTGAGISEEQLQSIFKPFTSYKPSGMGMGLAIAASIMDEHRGEIAIKSQPGQTTQVTLSLPLAKPSH